MKRLFLALLVGVLILPCCACCLFEGGNVEKTTVLTLEKHLQLLEKDHMSRLTNDQDKDDIGKAWKAAHDAVNALKDQASD